MNVVRFGVSVEKEVLDILDNYVAKNRFPNRSQAIRHLIQQMEVERQVETNEVVGGALTLVYDIDKREILEQITDAQMHYHHIILCSQHIRIDHNNSMQIIAMRGPAFTLKEAASAIIAVKGVVHGELSITKINNRR